MTAYDKFSTVYQNTQYKDVYRTKEFPQSGRIFKANCCLNVYNAHIMLASANL